MSDVKLLSISSGEELPKEEAPRTREGSVWVQIERVDSLRSRVSTVQVEQKWVKEYGSWKVDPTPWGEGLLWAEPERKE
jgi:hypothetical protein